MSERNIDEDSESVASTIGRVQSDTGAPDSAALPKTQYRPRRQATLYDAVAGKVLDHHSLGPKDIGDQQTAQDTFSTGAVPDATNKAPLAPDEVLFRRKDAPQRFQEHDVYPAHQRLLPDGGAGILPGSDLLKALHGYTSKFYEALGDRRGPEEDKLADFRSMDETALLAFGFLLEEAGRDALGRRGDLVFTEGVNNAIENPTSGKAEASDSDLNTVGHHDLGSWVRGPRKRRRLDDIS